MSFSSNVIQVDAVGKCFDIYDRPEDRLKQFLMPKLRAFSRLDQPSYHREFWALRDISFEVGKGQAVGIIGRNGSGKSTLLQIITGTMTPTYGSVITQGRTAALLELGSGFNPEFTGRENVYLNGTLLGLTQAQIDDKFDYIASFADIGDHLNQAVKNYSSGMMLRLAFAVQVAVEPEILIIDEALAVGDARFQLKCFRRLEEIKDHGTTILFVSHSTELVRSFCDFGLVLENGRTIYWGKAQVATVKYMEILFPEQAEATSSEQCELSVGDDQVSNASKNMDALPLETDQSLEWLTIDLSSVEGHTFGAGGANLESLKISGLDSPNILIGRRSVGIRCRFTWQIEFVRSLIRRDGYDANITLGVSIANNKGEYIFGCNGFDKGLSIDCENTNSSTVEFQFDMPDLNIGDYFLTVAIALGSQKNHVQLRWYDSIFQLKIFESDRNVYGVLAIDYEMKLLPATRSPA
jgi:lipopolysaccharide transport system ATP-binding protein